MKLIATIAAPGLKGSSLREEVDIPSRKDVAGCLYVICGFGVS